MPSTTAKTGTTQNSGDANAPRPIERVVLRRCDPEAVGELHADLPQDVASRTIRFWRMRRQTGDVAAA